MSTTASDSPFVTFDPHAPPCEHCRDKTRDAYTIAIKPDKMLYLCANCIDFLHVSAWSVSHSR